MWEKIIEIKEIGYENAIDIEVDGNHLFFANDILTHNSNSDVGLEDTSESFGLPATADLMFALISTEELEKLNQIMVKQLKNRYNDPAMYRKFVVGIDRSRMKLYDVDQSAQDLVDSGHDEEDDLEETIVKSPFKFKNKFSDFKF
jgi:hypothetical protein